MPVVIREQTKFSTIQKFRAWSERQLVDAAQEDLYRKYPGTGARPRNRGAFRTAVRIMFRTAFRLAPGGLRRRIMCLMLFRKGQDWNPA